MENATTVVVEVVGIPGVYVKIWGKNVNSAGIELL